MSVILSFFLGFRLSSYINGCNESNESSDKSKNKSPNNSLRNKINIIALTSFTIFLGITLYQLKNSNNTDINYLYSEMDTTLYSTFTQDQLDGVYN